MHQELMRLVYTSTHGGISKQELQTLSNEASDLHVQHGISGVIVVGEEDFFVVIEGEPLVVTRALTHIVKDHRHNNVTVLLASAIHDRMYRRWKVVELAESLRDESQKSESLLRADFNPSKMTHEQIETVLLALSDAG